MAKVIGFPGQESQIQNSETGSINTIAGYTQGNGYQSAINQQALYAVNWNSLQKVEDLILVLASIGFVFSPQHGHFDRIKHLLDLENPIIPQTNPEDVNSDFRKSEIKLPNL